MSRRKLLRITIVVVYVLAVTYIAGNWARRFAYLERGYDAIGGEYLFILLVAWVAYKLANIFCDAWKGETAS